MADEKFTHKNWESPGLHGDNLGAHDGVGAEFPKLLYKGGLEMPVADADAEAIALADGWAPHAAQVPAEAE